VNFSFGRNAALLILLINILLNTRPCSAAEAGQNQPAASPATAARDLFVTAGKSAVIESPVDIDRVSVANGDIAEAVVINPRELLVNGKTPGSTTLIVWQRGGNRLLFDLTVRSNNTVSDAAIDRIRQELRNELGDQPVTLTVENKNAILRGTVKDLTSAERAESLAATMGKVVNLLRVEVPPTDAQVLLKVRFATVDRTAVSEIGANLLSLGATGTIGGVSTGQFAPPRFNLTPTETTFTLSDALNIFLFRRDINLGATIRALQNRRLLEILAEPNVLAINGRNASFLAGGEFPYPTLQGGGAGLGAVTIQFREFGVRISFLPRVTPRGTVRLRVTPEVSALDYSNGLVFQGFTIPGLTTRRVQTEIELEAGQSFAIGGLLDNRITENLSKIPGLGDIPLLGKLFQSKSVTKNNSELLVLVTPELVRPIPAGQPLPEIEMPRKDFMTGGAATPPRTPGIAVTGAVPVRTPIETIPVEELIQSQRPLDQPAPAQQMPPVQYIPVPMAPPQAAPPPQGQAAPPATSGGGSS
jgi:pilus assembly protein CpaC